MKKLFENLIENSCHAEFISASQPLPEFIKLLPTFTNRVTCVKLKLLSFKSSPKSTDRATCVAPLSRPSDTLSLGEGKKCAFTLAEVLITLGIIGIVAALVIPGVVNGFRRKQLETAFKKADSVITTAMQATMFEHGLTNYYDFGRYCKGNYCSETKSEDFDDLNATFKEQLNIVEELEPSALRSAKMYNFWGDVCNQLGGCYANYYKNGLGGIQNMKVFILKDGMTVSDIRWNANNATPIGATGHRFTIIPIILFDTNGPYRGPNRDGYDLFNYDKMLHSGSYCMPLSRSLDGCYRSAIKDENPYDKSITYWEGLYRPKSWWENVRNNSKK